jgi:hypothetical protein
LDAGDATTIPDGHASLLVMGAAGFACFARSQDLAETTGQQAIATPNLAALASRYLKEFRKRLSYLSLRSQPAGPSAEAAPVGFALDKWDRGDGQDKR